MERKKVSIQGVEDFPETIDAYIWPRSEDVRVYALRKYCYVDIILNKDDQAIGSSSCSKCKKYVDPFITFCPYCGARSKGRRLLRKKEKPNGEQKDSPIRL